jgi:MscS family membrane protein
MNAEAARLEEAHTRHRLEESGGTYPKRWWGAARNDLLLTWSPFDSTLSTPRLLMINRRFALLILSVSAAVCSSTCWAQVGIPAPAPAVSQPPPPPDSLGRNTPRGTVVGFLRSARKGDYGTAVHYLDTQLRGARAITLARELSVVLDVRLPARLEQLSQRPEGSGYDPDKPDLDLVGTVDSASGPVDVVVQRFERGKNGAIWLFSKDTLAATPSLYEEVGHLSLEKDLPEFLSRWKIAQIPLYQWLFVFVFIPLVYVLAGLLNRLISPLAGRLRRRLFKRTDLANPQLLPPPVRLLVLVVVIRWMAANVNLPLLGRLFWAGLASIITIAASVWLALLFSAWGEERIRRRMGRSAMHGAVSVLRLVRRTFDVLVIFAGVVVTLYYFRVNVTAALAGLGVGGIAVALAAQKTLENVIGGISVIADGAVHVGDFVKVGDTVGTVDDIGLRSTRIRTLDRTMVTIPNGQISSVSLEEYSARDKFWFHPILSVRYETTPAQMRSVLEGIRGLLVQHPRVESDSARVRFLRFGTSSLDVEVFSYLFVRDWAHFLEVQEELLLRIMEAVQAAGTQMALPSQTTYLAASASSDAARVPELMKVPTRN